MNQLHQVRHLLPWFILFLLFFFTQGLRWHETLGLDQSLFACFGLFIPRGDVPYVDLWDSKPPALFYLYALAFQLFGPAPTTVRILDGGFTALGGLALFFLARRLDLRGGPGAALICIFYAHSPSFGGFWSSAQAETCIGPLAGLALLLMLYGVGQHQPFLQIATGSLLGLIGLLKVPGLGLAIPFLLYFSVLKLYRPLLYFLIGTLLLPCIAGLYLWHIDALELFWQATFVYGPLYLEAVSPPAYWTIAFRALSGIATQNLFLCSMALIGLAVAVKSIRQSADRPESCAAMLLLISWWISAYAIALVQRQFANYHFILILLPSALLTAVGGQYLWQAVQKNRRYAVFLVLGVIALLADGLRFERTYRPHMAHLFGTLDSEQFLRHFALGGYNPRLGLEIGRYVRQNSAADETLLVWGMAPDIYYHARRRPATRYPFHHLLLTKAPISRQFAGLPERRHHFLQRLRRDQPAFIAVGLADRNSFEPRGSQEQMRRFSEFYLYVRDHYLPDRIIGNYRIYRRRPQS